MTFATQTTNNNKNTDKKQKRAVTVHFILVPIQLYIFYLINKNLLPSKREIADINYLICFYYVIIISHLLKRVNTPKEKIKTKTSV